MTDTLFALRISPKEKEILSKVSQNNEMTITDYIRYRVFHNNPDVTNEKSSYESPAKDKHNYLSMAIINDIYWMLFYFILEQKRDEERQEFSEKCRDAAKKSIANYGYLKITKDE